MRRQFILDGDPSVKPLILRYGLPLVLAGALLAIRLMLVPYLGDHSPYLTFFAAVVFAAWYGGLGPGIAVTVASTAMAWYFIERVGSATLTGSAIALEAVFFAAQGFIVSYLIETTHGARRRTASLLQSISDGFFVYDRELRLVFMNRRGEQMSRQPQHELLGKKPWEAEPGIVGTTYHEGLIRASTERRPQRFDYYHAPFNAWFEVSVYPSKDGITVYSRDVTSDRRSHEELARAKNQIENMARDLEHRVEERTAQLNATIKELEAFSYSVSHDLRAPLRAIDGFSRMLQEDYDQRLDDEGRRILNVIRHNTVNMGNLIDGLLAFSRLGRQAMGHAPISMTELTHDAIKEVLGTETHRRIEFKVGDLPQAVGDRVLLRQVLINLLANAVKFTKFKDPGIVEVGGYAEDGHNTFFVKDNGVGFDMRYVDKLFGVFQRLHPATEFEGTGLGLAIVQRIVSRHGGRVWAEGELDKGTTIYFTLPRDPAA